MYVLKPLHFNSLPALAFPDSLQLLSKVCLLRRWLQTSRQHQIAGRSSGEQNKLSAKEEK